eukprot:TRINITY_DN14614_c0_g1_i1.p1 TRINITY_DN14614_c0_g1~~TRINITY_DN14614_c0_g1_i1.p1  ORF type:complete len:704 (+),score=196.09 TRINITY_DN14614_c0_g1_i1:74-2185(+)
MRPRPPTLPLLWLVALLGAAAAAGEETCADAQGAGSAAAVDTPVVRVWSAALCPDLVRRVTAEANHVFEGKHKDSTRSLWLPLPHDTKGAGTAMEEAVQVLWRYAFGPGAEPEDLGIVGAEIWAQSRSARAMINPHFDKDEALFQKSGTLITPRWSTVTYLYSKGGPTVIFNYSITPGSVRTDDNAGKVDPEDPRDAWFVYPKVGRHVVFRGDMWHAARGDLAPPEHTASDTRLTFLVNWWGTELAASKDRRAVRLTAKWAAKVRSPRTGEQGLPIAESKQPCEPAVQSQEEVAEMLVDGASKGTTRSIALPVGKGAASGPGESPLHFRLPLLEAESVTHVTWAEDAAWRGSGRLCRDNPFLAEVFRSEAPKAVALLEADQVAEVDAFLPTLAAEFGVKPLAVDAGHSHMFLSMFGLNRSDVPTVLALDDHFDSGDVLPRRTAAVRGHPAPLGAAVSADAVRALLASYTEKREKRLAEREKEAADRITLQRPGTWMKDPSGSPSHSVQVWQAAESRLESWADFERTCLARVLARGTLSAKGFPTVCLVHIYYGANDPGQSRTWPILAAVVDSSRFRPGRKAFEFYTAQRRSEVVERLQAEYNISDSALLRDAVVAIEHLPAQRMRVKAKDMHSADGQDRVAQAIRELPRVTPNAYQVRTYPSLDSGGWGVGDGAIGSFGQWVVELEGDVWESPEGDGQPKRAA